MACLSGPMLGIGLSGCTVGPDYESPEMKEAPRRSALNGESVPSRTVEGAVDIVWWKSFRDLQLSSLVERLVAQNLDLETAAERVIQSMAQRRVAASQGLPHIEGLCVPKTLSVLMTPRNHLSWRNDRAPVFRRGGLMVGTTNISMAAMSGGWFRRKARTPWLGGPRYLTMYLATLDEPAHTRA